MNIKVTDIGVLEPKSIREREVQLVEPETTPAPEVDVEVEVEPEAEPADIIIDEATVMNYLREKAGLELNSFDDLKKDKPMEELPPDVEAYYRYKKETGRGMEDFSKLNRDFDSINPDVLLKDYYEQTETGLDSEDIDMLMEEFSFDEEFDDELDIKKKKIARKKAIAKAKQYFEEQKEIFKQPLESVQEAKKYSEELEAYRQYMKESETAQLDAEAKGKWFEKQTSDLLNEKFKGFEFDVNGTSLVYSPGDALEIKKSNSTPMNLISKFLDKEGKLADAAGYHRALSVAMNPEKFAKFFYEQGAASIVSDEARAAKNVNMGVRTAPSPGGKGGLKITSLTPDSGRGLKIKSPQK